MLYAIKSIGKYDANQIEFQQCDCRTIKTGKQRKKRGKRADIW